MTSVLFPDAERPAHHLTQAAVLLVSGEVDNRVDLGGIRLSVDHTVAAHMAFDNFAHDQPVASQIQHMQYLALQVHRAFPNQRRGSIT